MRRMGRYRSKDGLTDEFFELFRSTQSVSSLLAENPSLTAQGAWKRLYGDKVLKEKTSSRSEDEESMGLYGLYKATTLGNFGPRVPSGLFLRIYYDALCTLGDDPMRGMVSPSLMGSHGCVPLTIVSVIPDIARHISNVIVRAEREVFLATNYWQNSVASKFIVDGLKELDRRAGLRNQRIVVRILYDRGSAKQLFEPHFLVSESEYTGENIGLPHPSEVPNLDMEVMNYHTPIIGTFHAKYVVVDRKIGLLQSNNVQDNDNLEMLIHLEGPIVDSLYDMALLSWWKKMNPVLPSLCDNQQVIDGVTVDGRRKSIDNGKIDGTFDGNRQENGSITLPPAVSDPPEHNTESPHYDEDIAGEITRVNSSLLPKPHKTHIQAVTRLLNHTVNKDFPADPLAPACLDPAELMTPYVAGSKTFCPMALVNRAPYGAPTHKSVSNPQNAAWLSALRNAQSTVFIQSPTLNAEPLLPAITEACERGVDVHCWVCLGYNDIGETLPHQNGHNEKIAHTLFKSVSPAAKQKLHYNWYVAKDQIKPLAQSPTKGRKRSCHVKIMIVDGHIGIMGNGNQDTQSWFHSQEINVMVDSKEVCGQWMEQLNRNQNTGLFGALNPETGVWTDEEGKEVDGATGVEVGKMGTLAKGVVGAVRRVKGTGGF
ncbi:minor cardiolipin synthase ClsB [Podospora australis]|uniref:Minor cardiolipin synthase ClsB n=1 Tax=Podospora australis TaxID=1536484 RepID=A0AAN6WVF8_9PEZI|nr:minor cardiolipin synthase ClsB [Podospora australis]